MLSPRLVLSKVAELNRPDGPYFTDPWTGLGSSDALVAMES